MAIQTRLNIDLLSFLMHAFPLFVLKRNCTFLFFNPLSLNEYGDRYITSAAVTLNWQFSMDDGNFIFAFVSVKRNNETKGNGSLWVFGFQIAEATKCFCPFISFALKLC